MVSGSLVSDEKNTTGKEVTICGNAKHRLAPLGVQLTLTPTSPRDLLGEGGLIAINVETPQIEA